MPHGPFQRVVARPSPQNRIRVGDINELQIALENTPTLGEVGIPVSPLLFGAKGDGVTDDSAALASMFTQLGLNNTTTGPVFVDGTWNGGHLRLGNTHIWVDAAGAPRYKTSAPTVASDGTAL